MVTTNLQAARRLYTRARTAYTLTLATTGASQASRAQAKAELHSAARLLRSAEILSGVRSPGVTRLAQ